jgi:hypothetical protein
MNSKILERIANEKNMDIMRSILFFIAFVVVISVVGLVLFAAH